MITAAALAGIGTARSLRTGAASGSSTSSTKRVIVASAAPSSSAVAWPLAWRKSAAAAPTVSAPPSPATSRPSSTRSTLSSESSWSDMPFTSCSAVPALHGAVPWSPWPRPGHRQRGVRRGASTPDAGSRAPRSRAVASPRRRRSCRARRRRGRITTSACSSERAAVMTEIASCAERRSMTVTSVVSIAARLAKAAIVRGIGLATPQPSTVVDQTTPGDRERPTRCRPGLPSNVVIPPAIVSQTLARPADRGRGCVPAGEPLTSNRTAMARSLARSAPLHVRVARRATVVSSTRGPGRLPPPCRSLTSLHRSEFLSSHEGPRRH